MKKLKKQKIEKVEKLKNQSWKNKVEIWRIENLKTIVSNENLKRKLQFKKSRKVVCLHILMVDKQTQQKQLFSLL